MLDQRDRRAELVIHVEDEAAHVLLLLHVHPGHRLVEEQQLRLHRQRAAQLHALLQAIGKLADGNTPDRLDFQEVDDLLDETAMRDLLPQRGAVAQQLPEQSAAHLQRASGHEIVERRHSFEQSNVLERARDALTRRNRGTHARARPALERDASPLRMIEAVDDVQHGGLAGAVRTDDGANLATPDVEGDVGDRLHAAEAERDAFDGQQHLASLSISPHAALSSAVGECGDKSLIRTRAEIMPLRPSSNVTSVAISASPAPLYSASISLA